MRSIIGQCPDCCSCPAPTSLATSITASLIGSSRTASKSKAHVTGVNPGYESSPPRVFRGCSVEGELVYTSPKGVYDDEGNLVDCGECVGDAPGGFSANSEKYSGKNLVDYDGNTIGDCQHWLGWGDGDTLRCAISRYWDPDVVFPGLGWTEQTCGDPFPLGHSFSITNTETTSTFTGCGCSASGTDGAEICTGSIVYTATDEYTTAELKSHTRSSLSAWSADSPTSSVTSQLTLSSDEISCLITQCRYKISLPASDAVKESVDFLVRLKKTFTPADGGTPTVTYENVTISYDGTAKESDWFDLMEPDTPGTTALTIERGVLLVTSFKFPVPKVGSGKCYKLTWKKRTTPIDGGDPTDEDEDWKWDGDVPEDYDPEDEDTWPVSPTYYYPTPEDGGIVSVEEVEAKCTGCAT